MKNSFIVNFILFITVFITSFIVCSKTIFGADITSAPFNPDYAQWLKDSMFGNGSTSSGSVPSGSAIINGYAPQLSPYLLDQINQNLYDTYGYDLNDAYSDVAMSVLDYDETSSERVQLLQTLTGGLYDNFSAITSAGLTLGKVAFDNTYGQIGSFFDTYVVGAYDEVSGKISKAFDNVVYKLKDSWFEFWNPFSASNISNFTNSPFLLTRSFSSSNVNNLDYVTLYFSVPVLLYADSYNKLRCVYPLDSCEDVSDLLFGFGARNGYSYDFYPINASSQMSQFVINGVTYCNYYIKISSSDGAALNKSIGADNIPYNLDDVKFAIANYPTIFGSDYSYKRDLTADGIDINSLLSGLSDKYLTKEDLESLLDIISRANIDVYVEDGVTSTVAELDPALVAELEALIQSILELSLSLDAELDTMPPSVDPTPPTDSYPDIYDVIDVPITPIDTIGSALTVPYMFSSIFEPIFIAFGGGLFSLWLFVPTLIVFVAIIWAIK